VAARRAVVVGTAGHVDHGKSSLVRALTGTDPDRLAEEKARGLTIELGFAWCEVDDPAGGEAVVASFVDVPGHEDFLGNMLAGAGGIDAAMLVVAADEGPMPQTREHLAILELLGVRPAAVALTKADLVDEDWRAMATEAVAELVRGTAFAGRPIVPVSAVAGTGLDELRGALAAALGAAPQPPDRGRARLAVDRAFTLAGFGTVVTGTLRDGTMAPGEELVVLPGDRVARARGVQSHGRAVSAAAPGERTAVNLSGLAPEDVPRGSWVVRAGSWRPTRLLDVSIEVLSDTPVAVAHDMRVHLFLGAAEVPAIVRLIGAREVGPGERGAAQLRLSRPVVAAAGDRFVLRRPSPGATVGGGRVLDARPAGRRRRFRAETVARFRDLESGDAVARAWQVLRSRDPCPAAALDPADTGLEPADRDAALAALATDGRALTLGPLWLTDAGWADLRTRAERDLGRYHARFPLRRGRPIEEARARLGLPAAALAPFVARAAEEGWLAREDDMLRLPTHDVALAAGAREEADRLLARFAADPYRPPGTAEAAAAVGAEMVATLCERGEIVDVGEGVLFGATAYGELCRWVEDTLDERGELTVADLRDRFATSRKYALALLEHLDRRRVTRRLGDRRVRAVAPARAADAP
jgi:selenocysteine-specific elongation factor